MTRPIDRVLVMTMALGCSMPTASLETEHAASTDATPSDEVAASTNSELREGPPPHHRGSGPPPPEPPAKLAAAPPPLPDSPRRLESRWFRAGHHRWLAWGEELADGFVAVGEEPELGDGISRLAADGRLLWHVPQPAKRCSLSEAHNVVCNLEALVFASYDDEGREVWRRDLAGDIAVPGAQSGFGKRSLDEHRRLRMRTVDDFLFVEIQVVRADVEPPKRERAVVCLSLDGELAWVEGGGAGPGLSEALADNAFEVEAERAVEFAHAGLPSEPWRGLDLPLSSPALAPYLDHPRDLQRWFAIGSGWVLVLELGAHPRPGQRAKMLVLSATGERENNFDFDPPAPALWLTRLVPGPPDRVYGLWSDGRLDHFSLVAGERWDRTYARAVASFEEPEGWYLLVDRGNPPPGVSERLAGVELFAMTGG